MKLAKCNFSPKCSVKFAVNAVQKGTLRSMTAMVDENVTSKYNLALS